MAEYLASIFGTEKDKVNCSFYFKIGACRHGDRCSRIHNKPTFSQTILLSNLYQNPSNAVQNPDGTQGAIPNISEAQVQEHFDNFFEDIFVELEDKYGEIEEMNVCDNLGDHLVGNVYIKFKNEEDAEKAVNHLNNRWFGGRPIYAELSPVTDFREACCRQYEMGECTRSGFCNFMHLKPISRDLRRELYGRTRRSRSPRSRSRDRDKRRRSRSRDRSRRDRDRSTERRRDKRSRSRSPRRHKERSRSRDRRRDDRHRDRDRRSSKDDRKDRKNKETRISQSKSADRDNEVKDERNNSRSPSPRRSNFEDGQNGQHEGQDRMPQEPAQYEGSVDPMSYGMDTVIKDEGADTNGNDG